LSRNSAAHSACFFPPTARQSSRDFHPDCVALVAHGVKFKLALGLVGNETAARLQAWSLSDGHVQRTSPPGSPPTSLCCWAIAVAAAWALATASSAQFQHCVFFPRAGRVSFFDAPDPAETNQRISVSADGSRSLRGSSRLNESLGIEREMVVEGDTEEAEACILLRGVSAPQWCPDVYPSYPILSSPRWACGPQLIKFFFPFLFFSSPDEVLSSLNKAKSRPAPRKVTSCGGPWPNAMGLGANIGRTAPPRPSWDCLLSLWRSGRAQSNEEWGGLALRPGAAHPGGCADPQIDRPPPPLQ